MLSGTMRPGNLEPVAVPEELRGVPRSVLEGYVLECNRQLVRLVAERLSHVVPVQAVEAAFGEVTAALRQASGVGHNSGLENLCLRFRHRCRFIGCLNKECGLCKNNPNKRCREDDNFDECYADNQVLRAKCEADIHLELVNKVTGQPHHIPGLELQVCVIDGDAWSDAPGAANPQPRKLLKSDEGDCLINSALTTSKPDVDGHLLLKLQDGVVRLPDISVTDKNDTFHAGGDTFGTFRLMATAVKRDLYGRAVPVEGMPIAVSNKFVVKTQRALNDYRKSEYPHYKDELTRLKFIGSITAQRLREIQAHLGYDVPFTSIETVEQLKHLMLYADQNRQVENKLLELLNMKGKHKAKWDYLREILAEKIVYDDASHRAWYADDTATQGLLFACKQGQVNLDKPLGMFRRVQQGGQGVLQVYATPDPATAELQRVWRAAAEAAWASPGHGRWTMVTERIELMSANGPALVLASPTASGQLGGTISPAMSVQEGLDEQQAAYLRGPQMVPSPRSRPDGPTDTLALRRASQTLPTMAHGGMDGAAPGAGAPGRTYSVAFHSASPPLSGGLQDLYRHAGGMDAGGGIAYSAFSPSAASGHGALTVQGLQTASPRSDGPTGDGFHAGSMRSRPEDRTSRQRHRRASADVGAVRAASAGLSVGPASMPSQPHPSELLYTTASQSDGLGKRQRTSAPSGLHGGEAGGDGLGMARTSLVNPASTLPPTYSAVHALPLDLGADRARNLLYHYESSGRHLPVGRRSAENLAASEHSMVGVFDAHDLELDSLLQNLEANGGGLGGGLGGVKVEINPAGPGDLGSGPNLSLGTGPASGSSQATRVAVLGGAGSGGVPSPTGPGATGVVQPHPYLAQPSHMGQLLSSHHQQAHHPQHAQHAARMMLMNPQQHAQHGLSHMLHPLQLHGPPAGVLSSHPRHGLGAPTLSWQSNELSASIQASLRLAEAGPGPGPGHPQGRGGPVGQGQPQPPPPPQPPAVGTPPAQGQQQGLSDGRQPMLMVPDSDSFRTLSRALRHTDSDSFKNLFSPITQYGADPSFDRALQDMIQGRTSNSM